MKKVIYLSALMAVCITVLNGCGTDEEVQSNKDAYRQIGINCMEQEDYEGAIDAFQCALDQSLAVIGDEEIDTCYYKAQAQYAAGKTEDAAATYQALIDYDKKNEDAYYLLGCLYLKEADENAAKKNFDLAAEYADHNYDVYIAVYNQYMAVDKQSAAEEYLKLGLENTGKSANDYCQRGRIKMLLGDTDAAQTELETAIDKKSEEAVLYRAQLYELQDDSGKASALYEEYLDKNKENAQALSSFGCMKLAAEDYAGAIECFTAALEQEDASNRQELQKNLVYAYERSGDFEAARRTMKSYTQEYPNDEAAAREYQFLETR